MRYILESQIPPNGYIGKNLYIVKRALFNELKTTYTTDPSIDSNNPDTELLLSLFQNKHLPNNRPYTLESIYSGLNRKAEIIYELTPDDLRRYYFLLFTSSKVSVFENITSILHHLAFLVWSSARNFSCPITHF